MTATLRPPTLRPSRGRPSNRPSRPAMAALALCAVLAYSHSTAWTVADACHFSEGGRSLDRPWDAVGWFPTILFVIDFPISRFRRPEPSAYKLRWRAGRPVWIIRSDEGLVGSYHYFDLAGFLISSASWGCQLRCGPDDFLIWTGPAIDADPQRAFDEDDRPETW